MSSRFLPAATCALFALALAGCTASTGRETALPAAADPAARTAKARYAPVMAGYQHHAPVQPANWQELNRRVAPPGAFPQPQTNPSRRERRR